MYLRVSAQEISHCLARGIGFLDRWQSLEAIILRHHFLSARIVCQFKQNQQHRPSSCRSTLETKSRRPSVVLSLNFCYSLQHSINLVLCRHYYFLMLQISNRFLALMTESITPICYCQLSLIYHHYYSKLYHYHFLIQVMWKRLV